MRTQRSSRQTTFAHSSDDNDGDDADSSTDDDNDEDDDDDDDDDDDEDYKKHRKPRSRPSQKQSRYSLVSSCLHVIVHRTVRIMGRIRCRIIGCHAADCQPTAPMPLVSLVQSAGTLYRTI